MSTKSGTLYYHIPSKELYVLYSDQEKSFDRKYLLGLDFTPHSTNDVADFNTLIERGMAKDWRCLDFNLRDIHLVLLSKLVNKVE